MAAGDKIHVTSEPFSAGRTDYAAGTFVIEAAAGTADRVAAMADQLGLNFTGLRSEPSAAMAALTLPKVGMYKSYVASMDEGWTRWVLEDYGFDLVLSFGRRFTVRKSVAA